VLGGAHHRPRPGRGQAVCDEHEPGGGHDVELPRSEPVAQRYLHARHSRRRRVAVPPERHRRPLVDGALRFHDCRVRHRRQRHKHLGVGPLADGRPHRPLAGRQCVGLRVTARGAQPGVTRGGPEVVQAHLGLLGLGRRHGPPPPAAHELHSALHRSLAVAPPGRARGDDGAIVLGHRSERRLDIGRARHDHRGQPVGAPHPGCSPQTAQHPVDGLDEMGLVHRLAQHLAGPPRVRQGAEQAIGRAAPRGPAALGPVPLNFLAARMLDLDGLAALHPRARLAVRAQAGGAQLPGEARICAGIPEREDLVVEGARPQVRIVSEPGLHVVGERHQRVGPR